MHHNRLVNLLISLGSCFSLVYIYLQALLFPASHVDFIFKTGLLTFVIEFFTIQSNAFFHKRTSNSLKELLEKSKFIIIYSAFVFIFSIGFNNWYPALIFILSMVAKAFGGELKKEDAVTVEGIKKIPANMLYAVPFILLVFLVLSIQPLLYFIFPFGEEVMMHRPVHTSGAFVDQPQTLLVWGVLYFASCAFIEVWYYHRNKSQQSLGSKVVL